MRDFISEGTIGVGGLRRRKFESDVGAKRSKLVKTADE